MNSVLESLRKLGVRSIKNEYGIMLETHEEDLRQIKEIDEYIIKLLSEMKKSCFQKVRFECPRLLLNKLTRTNETMITIGERVIYSKEFHLSRELSAMDYETWSPTESVSISFLADVMDRDVREAERFLMNMETELPAQVNKMYTVYKVKGEPVGVVFPHIEPDTESEGRIFWIGIHPKFTRKGYGKKLHLIGLSRLVNDFDAKSYLGATGIENTPMRRIMNANGCSLKHTVITLEFIK
ncbi:GNAT family N-acetyltransferase [Sutcliffiella halmapala]|uniref:GNAT family N-acetyltransferase n=1 Tax=Sutcliffiella halmapala TaxID=79882 RepID=UPI000995580F|nr:GNAT family N-acetyltransferase [Sutcliffiella halmapala]